jgi:hypothetical protein
MSERRGHLSHTKPDAQWRQAGLLAAAVLILSISAVVSYHFPTYTQAFYAYVGRAIVEGKLPYRDVWDNKLPSIHYVNALWQLSFGGNYFLHHLAQLAVLLITVALFAAFARREGLAQWGAASLIFALLLSLPDIGQWNYTEPYAFLFIVAAFVALQRDVPLLGGVALALAATFWIPSSVTLVAMLVYVHGRGGRGASVRLVAAFAATTVLYWAVLTALFGPATIVGLLRDMRSYEDQKWTSSAPFWMAVRSNIGETLLSTGLLIPLVVLLAVIRVPGTPRERFALAWLACSLAGAAVNLNFSDHYFVPSLAPLAFAIAAFASSARFSTVRAVVCAVLAVGLSAYAPKLWYAMHRAFVGQRETAQDAASVSSALAAAIPPTAPILVYGADQGIYLRANRDAAGRFAFMSGIEQTPSDRRGPRLREYAADLHAAAAVVEDRKEPVPPLIQDVLRKDFVPLRLDGPAPYRHFQYTIYLNRRVHR